MEHFNFMFETGDQTLLSRVGKFFFLFSLYFLYAPLFFLTAAVNCVQHLPGDKSAEPSFINLILVIIPSILTNINTAMVGNANKPSPDYFFKNYGNSDVVVPISIVNPSNVMMLDTSVQKLRTTKLVSSPPIGTV